MDQLRRIMESDSYKWHLKWATNYTVLSLTFTCIFALEVSRHRDDLNAREVYDTVASIAHILADYHDPFFHQLIQVRLSHHPGASSYMIPDPTHLHTSQDNFGLNQSPHAIPANPDTGNPHVAGVQFQLPMDPSRETLAPDIGFDGVYRQNALNQLLETPDWMMNPSSMLVMDLDDWQSNDVLGNGG
ncbi:hypothetical protein NW762_010763 [Fusarium torreyae]|uniref:Uncharacterized protein n=1 Tax=Fusarium torreyae TaxID=1237075 RepID=A0A9W8V9Z9_9HYPO|nr:hypothetical protein NW762_010763 [Fusarium torreyae]